ncbi:hypothetical protein [Clostridium vincentii]|uniref:Uncharacterized protein n=1 Tax=Clostridium vincentii TaxID=52704 RepID=A0A2T0BDA1_9CLOT|nr:hypothetical protein [Clostridium vincentii]PRR81880.1 hypothetical protein CLVI_22260 [Clostridium vincentii]
MDKGLYKKIMYINEFSFFFGWTIIFLLGADKPPPIGFLWLVLLTGFLDGIQFLYLKIFLPKLFCSANKLFIKNLMFFSFGGLAVGLLVMIINFEQSLTLGLLNNSILLIVLTIVGLLYGIYFYWFNSILIRWIK